MPQRCSYCGKTEKQHKGKACISISGGEERMWPAKKIICNRVQCSKCNDIIESLHCHDFKYCSCKTVAVDGGKDYLRRVFSGENPYIELSEKEDVEVVPNKETQTS